MKIIDKADSTKDLKKAYDLALKEIEKTEIDVNREVLHVDLTGEIYLVNDEFSNQNIERELGRMGVQTRRSLTVGSFLKDAIIPKAFQNKETHLQRAERMAKPYLMRDIGGDALECISDVVFAHEKGKDGIIHISPFTCMPEIMSQNIFPKMRENVDIPILTLIMDEQTGRAGYQANHPSGYMRLCGCGCILLYQLPHGYFPVKKAVWRASPADRNQRIVL